MKNEFERVHDVVKVQHLKSSRRSGLGIDSIDDIESMIYTQYRLSAAAILVLDCLASSLC